MASWPNTTSSGSVPRRHQQHDYPPPLPPTSTTTSPPPPPIIAIDIKARLVPADLTDPGAGAVDKARAIYHRVDTAGRQSVSLWESAQGSPGAIDRSGSFIVGHWDTLSLQLAAAPATIHCQDHYQETPSTGSPEGATPVYIQGCIRNIQTLLYFCPLWPLWKFYGSESSMNRTRQRGWMSGAIE